MCTGWARARPASMNGCSGCTNENTTDVPPRASRISFYVFNSLVGKASAAILEEPVRTRQWIHAVTWPMRRRPRSTRTACSRTAIATPGPAPAPAATIRPTCGSRHSVGSPRFGLERGDRKSFFLGAIREVGDLEPCPDGTGGRQPAWRRRLFGWPRSRVPAEPGHCLRHCPTAQWQVIAGATWTPPR